MYSIPRRRRLKLLFLSAFLSAPGFPISAQAADPAEAETSPEAAGDEDMRALYQKYLDQGLSYFVDLKDYQKAIECFQEALKLNPRDTTARKALRLVKKKLAEGGKSPEQLEEAEVAKARQHYDGGQFVLAAVALKAVLEKNPDSAAAKRLMARVEQTMDSALRAAPEGSFQWFVHQGTLAYSRSRPEEAVQHWRKAARLNSEDPMVALALERAEADIKLALSRSTSACECEIVSSTAAAPAAQVALLNVPAQVETRPASNFMAPVPAAPPSLSLPVPPALKPDLKLPPPPVPDVAKPVAPPPPPPARAEPAKPKPVLPGFQQEPPPPPAPPPPPQPLPVPLQDLSVPAGPNPAPLLDKPLESYSKPAGPKFEVPKPAEPPPPAPLAEVAGAKEPSAPAAKTAPEPSTPPAQQDEAEEILKEVRSLHAKKDYTTTLETLKRFLELYPDHAKGKELLGKVTQEQTEAATKHYNDGMLAYVNGKYSQAFEEWQKVLKINPQHPTVKRIMLKAFFSGH